jgi:hypothetical protein
MMIPNGFLLQQLFDSAQMDEEGVKQWVCAGGGFRKIRLSVCAD